MNARGATSLLRPLLGRLREERGIAIVTAMLISMVVVTLGATSVTLAIHNTQQSAYDRRNVQSIHAAEAGINYYFSHLQSGGAESFSCSISQSLETQPVARFEATAAFYDSAGIELPCPLRGAEPHTVVITSIGRSASAPPARVMQAEVQLAPVPGGPFGEFAIFSETSPQFNSNVRVFGGDSVGGNVYSNDDVEISSNSTIYGSVEAQGSVTLGSNAHVKRSVLAGSSVLLNSNATVFQDVTSSTSSVSLQSNAHVFENARAATTITLAGNAKIDGAVLPNASSPPPAHRSFPQLVFDPLAWQEAGYTIVTFYSCLEAKAFIGAIPTGSHVVRIAAPCDLSYVSGERVTLRGNLALVSNGSLTMNSNTEFLNTGSEHNLFLLFGLGGLAPCDISFKSNSEIGSGIQSVVYTPCTIDMRSNSIVLEGQMFGGSVEFNANSSLTYEPIGVPGHGVATYDENILYIREVS